LAGRSAEAAKEIKSLIDVSVQRVASGSGLVDKAGSTMQEVVSAIHRVADIVGEISAASKEQSMGVHQVGEAITQMDQVTQQNAALVEEMAAAASSLKSQSEDLVQTVAVFKLTAGDQYAATHSMVATPVHVHPQKINGLKETQPRIGGSPKAAATRAHGQAVRPPTANQTKSRSLAAPSPKPAVQSAGGNEGDWETF
jgi:hypothetical protein